MADMLTTISTENLTAAVTSLLQRPLQDTDQTQFSARESRQTQVQESSSKKQQTKKTKLTELSGKFPQTASNRSSPSQQAMPTSNDDLSQKALLPMQGQSVSQDGSHLPDHADSNKSAKSSNSKRKKSSRTAKKKKHSKVRSNKETDKNISESNNSLQIYEQNHGASDTFHESVPGYSSFDSDKTEMSRKLTELSRQVLNNQVETQTPQSNFPGGQGCILQENSSIKTMTLASATSLTSVVVPSSSNPAASSAVESGNIPVMLPPVSLPSGVHSPSGPLVSQSNSESNSQPVPTVSQADLSSQLPSFNSFSTPWVPQHLTDGMVPMLSLGPGLNIPLSVRPANPQLVSALLSRFPTILPKPDLTKSSSPSDLSQPVSSKSCTSSNLSQPLVSSETATPLTTTASSPSAALSSSSPISSQYLSETMTTPWVSNLPLGDPTGMELQNLMSIVYGHLMDREQSGRTPTPGSLMLDSSFPHISTPYHSVPHPSLNTSQSEVSLPVATSTSSGQLESAKADSYRATGILKMAGGSQPSMESGTPDSHQQGLHHHSEVDISHGEHPHSQPTAVNTDITPGHQPGMIQQPVLHTLQPPSLTGFTNVQSTVPPYLTHGHHQPYDISHQSVISHTERLRHPEPAERYQFNGQHNGPSTCMYMHHPERQNGSQGSYHYNSARNAERYRSAEYSDTHGYDTSQTIQSDHCGQNFAAQQEYDTTPATGSQPEHVTTQEHTEEGSAAMEEGEEESDIYCLECNKMWKGPCQMHNTEYNHIEDSPVPSRAKASLPACFYLKQTATSGYQSLGVWCKEALNSRTQFGPVVGPSDFEKRDTDLHFNPFKILHRNSKTETLNMTDENSCNWIMFVQLAKGMLEQNCVLYQQGKQLFIITKKEIKKDSELLMWFSSDLCLHLKVSADPGVCNLVQCSSCGLNFITKKSLHSHRRLKHPSEIKKSWSCSFCEKTYSSNTKLNAHLISHMGLKPHRCLYCNKEFTDHSNLKVHQYIHTGQKKYKCSTCNRTFRQKAHLNSHMLTHTGEKKIQCNYCDKQFARQSDCKIHEYQHTKERMYTCDVCKKVFFKTQTFKRHQKVHTGERNYMCNKCFKGFHTKYHRDRHLKICKEKGGKESTYMSLEEVANLDNTCDAVPLTVKAHEVAAENQSNHGNGERHFQNNMFST